LLREQLAILDHRVGELEKMPVGALTGALVARKLAELRAERHHLRTVLVKAFAETDAAAAEE
jgi:hypothetical protein